jgi:signal transduction histidine kinase
VAHYVEVCLARADALERLIADLFAFTRLEYLEQEPERVPLELGALLRGAADGVRPLARDRRIEIILDGAEEPYPLVGDQHLLGRTVENLLDNPLRHTPDGGSIRIQWGRHGQALSFSVEDTGPGIAEQDLPHLFTPLYRAETSRNRQTGGAGLGLTIARRILRSHGGDLTAANAAAGGARFTATLPTASHARPVPEVAAS